MNRLHKVLACACLGAAALAGAAAAASDPVARPAATAALRAYAASRIGAVLERRAVRSLDPAVTSRDARRLAAALDQAQLRALASGDDVEDVVPQLASAGPRPITEAALGDAETDLVFVPLPPCRIIDTRLAGGPIAAGSERHFEVAGTENFLAQGGNGGGCGVPLGATEPQAAAAVINFIAVSPAGPGNLRAWEFGQPEPLASIINYAAVPGLNIANGVIVPIAGVATLSKDLTIQADAQGTQVVADVTGYFTRFPLVQVGDTSKSITVVEEGGAVPLFCPAGCTDDQGNPINNPCTLVGSCQVAANAPGQVIIRAWAQVSLDHAAVHSVPGAGGDRVTMGVKEAEPTKCSNNDQTINATDFELPDSLPAEADIDTTLGHKRIFAHAGTKTYFMNAKMPTGASAGDTIESWRLICTFIPD